MWKPILPRDLHDRAWAVIEDTARELALHGPTSDSVLVWTYLASVRDELADGAARAAERFAATLADGIERAALHEGLAGVGFIATHIGSGASAALDAIDARLLAMPHPLFDVVGGLAGLGVYFREREHARGLEFVVDRLEARAPWFSAPELLADADRAQWPAGRFDCGVAHGIPGVVGVLGRIATPRALALRDRGVRWLAEQRVDQRLPMCVLDDRRPAARTAWCYGEPGAITALWPDVPDPTGWIARATCADACLCHGAAGLGHMANRLWQATRDDVFLDAARTWLARALTLPIDETGDRSRNVLSGRAGVALALLAAVSDLEPAWDRMLVCDLPVES